MELDEQDRIGRRPRRGSLFGTLTYLLFGLTFVALAAVALIGGSADAIKGALMSAGIMKREDFSAIYQRLKAAPLSPESEASSAIGTNLEKLRREPCDSHAIFALADAAAKAHEERWAADALVGWSAGCGPDNAGELRRAASLLIDLHDYTKAESITSGLLDKHPTSSDYWYLTGKAEVGLGRPADALLSYANTIHLAPRPTQVGRWVFQEMSDIYASSKRYCEAIAPIEDYMSYDLAARSTPQNQQIIDGYAAKGHCVAFASGSETFPVGDSNVIRTRVAINGVTGTFVVDTGASFVTVAKGFAAKARLDAGSSGSVRAITANGAIYAKLASASSVKVGRVEAKQVPVAIQDASLGDIDGLLGRSFLSRFDLTIASNHWSLRPKAVGAAAR